MKKQNGFTLIELVVVIAILGILAAIALPKFVDLTGDARKAKMQAALGAISSAAALGHAKYLASGNTATNYTAEGATVVLVNGYPAADAAAVVGIAAAAGLNVLVATDYTIDKATATQVTIKDGANPLATCQIIYKEAASAGAIPTITPTLTTC